jgi:ribosomal protein S18 acetylase RimI-like enzyme
MLLRRGGSVPLCDSPLVPIRQAKAADLERVRELVEDAYGPWVPVVGLRPGPMDADYEALVEAGHVFVLAEPEVIAVLVLEELDGGVLMVENVAVDPGQQGRGIGPMLLDFAEDQARSRDLEEMQLYTHELMASNIELYNRLGWEEFERRESGGFARVFFRKRVTSSPAEDAASS